MRRKNGTSAAMLGHGRRLAAGVAAAALGATLLTGATMAVGEAPSAQSATCYTTARDATYNKPGCFSVRHWVTRASTGSTRHYGAWVGKGGTSMVITWVDWTSSGTQS